MGDLVEDERLASQDLVGRRLVVEDESRLPVEDRSGVFHSAVRKAGNEDEFELLEGMGEIEVAGLMGQSEAVEQEELCPVGLGES